MAVKVQFQIGHSSKLRSKKTVEGFTHDWELYVRGVQQADISAFVEKIIFNLHESFQKPKRVCNKPPYVIQESGYAGFIVFIDIYFRNRDEPKKVQFNYDLDLQTTGPPQHRHDVKTFIFDNPSEEFRQKLLKGGGVPVSGVVAGSQPNINNNIVAMASVPNLSHTPGDVHKPLMTEGKKHKSRPDDARSNSFANLFGPPITKTSAIVATAVTKHSPDNKSAMTAAHVAHQSSAGTGLPNVKEKSSKDKDKSSEKSKERSEKREKHHKQSLTSPHKEGRSESKKSDGSKHDKRDKTEEKSKKDKNREKDRERDRDKSSGANVNNSINNSKRPPSPKLAREHSPHKSLPPGVLPPNAAVNNANSIQRPSSSSSGKIGEEVKTSSKSSSKDSTGESKSKESKQKESSSSSSGKKSKKEKKDKDKERDKEKRHEEREKQKLTEQSQQRSSGTKEDGGKITNNINAHANNTISLDIKNSKSTINPINTNIPNDIIKKPEKLAKQDLFKASNDKTSISNTTLAPLAPVQANNSSTHSSTDKKSSSNTSLNSNSNPAEKDKRSHKHKKKEKSKDKDKDRERDKERDKDKDKERDKEKEKNKDKEKEKEQEAKKEKEAKDKHTEERTAETFLSNQQSTTTTKALSTQPVNAAEEQPNSLKSSAPSSSITSNAAPFTETTQVASASSSSSSAKSSKNKDKKSKEKSSSKEEKLKHKTNDIDTGESKAKQPKLSSSVNSTHTSSSVSTSSSSCTSSVTTSITNAANNPPNLSQPAVTAVANSAAETNLNLDLSDADSLPTAPIEQVAPSLPNNNNNNNNNPSAKPTVQPSPNITHSDSSNSSFPDLPLPKQQLPTKPQTSRERPKSIAAPVATATAPLINPVSKEPPKVIKSTAKEKALDKPSKEEEREKKRRRNSQAVNTFIEPPLKQLKTKEPSKSVREKSKSPSLRNAGSRASISSEASTTFLQPSASPSSTAAAAPLPPPSSAPSAAHSPALSATEAVGNATSATANAATCNSNSTPSSLTSNTGMLGPHQLPLDYLSELQELHHKIMTLQDNEDLQHVVELIAATGCYEITTKTFDFDLCKLDRGTVQRLQEFFATSVS